MELIINSKMARKVKKNLGLENETSASTGKAPEEEKIEAQATWLFDKIITAPQKTHRDVNYLLYLALEKREGITLAALTNEDEIIDWPAHKAKYALSFLANTYSKAPTALRGMDLISDNEKDFHSLFILYAAYGVEDNLAKAVKANDPSENKELYKEFLILCEQAKEVRENHKKEQQKEKAQKKKRVEKDKSPVKTDATKPKKQQEKPPKFLGETLKTAIIDSHQSTEIKGKTQRKTGWFEPLVKDISKKTRIGKSAFSVHRPAPGQDPHDYRLIDIQYGESYHKQILASKIIGAPLFILHHPLDPKTDLPTTLGKLRVMPNIVEEIAHQSISVKTIAKELKKEVALKKEATTPKKNAAKKTVLPSKPNKEINACPHLKPLKESFPSLSQLEQWAQERLSGKVILHPRAIRGAKESQYHNPDLVFQSLLLLGHEYRDMRLNGGHHKFSDALKETGLDHGQSIHRVKRQKFPTEYILTFNQKAVEMDRHLLKGNSQNPKFCLRIYFASQLINDQVLVGNLPYHLPNNIG